MNPIELTIFERRELIELLRVLLATMKWDSDMLGFFPDGRLVKYMSERQYIALFRVLNLLEDKTHGYDVSRHTGI